jgi:hypothetical protein
MGNFRGGMMAFFMTLGVPIYALTMAQFAGFAMTHAIQMRQRDQMKKPIEEAEFIFAANSKSGVVASHV